MEKRHAPSLKHRTNKCLNCEMPLDKSDAFCPNCGQKNSSKKLSIFHLIEEFLSSIFSYDSKLHKTLATLILKPGKITRDYVNGKRATYTNPFRFFLSITILYFLMISYSSDFDQANNTINESIIKDSLFIENTVNSLKKTIISENEKNTIDSILKKYNPKREINTTDPPSVFFEKLNEKLFIKRMYEKTEYFYEDIQRDKYFNYDNAIDQLKISPSIENRVTFNIAKSAHKTYHNPGSFFANLISKLPFIIFFFLPFYSIFIWIIYSFEKYQYIDHLIFSFHTQTLFTLLLIVCLITKWAFNQDLHIIAFLAFLIYLYKSMRGFYKESRIKTIVKFIYINTIFLILATISIVTIVLVGIYTY